MPAEPISSKEWHALCSINDIDEDTSKGFAANSIELFAVKKDGQIYAYQNRCPHLGVELNWLEDQFLDSDNALIQCATHGALFLIEDGRCVSGPCNGQALVALQTDIRDNQLYVNLDGLTPR